MSITPKQEAFIVSLANQITGDSHRFISQHKRFLCDRFNTSTGRLSRLDKAQASAMIDDLKADIENAA